MTKQDILDILDKDAAGSRSSMKLVIVGGIILLLASGAMFLFMKDPGTWAWVIGGIGAFIIFGAIRAMKTNMYEKQAQKIKDVFYVNPSDLVWSYTHVTKGNAYTIKNVVLKFRDGTEFQIAEDAIPDKDCNALVAALTVINPKMIVGYSEETEKLYRAKQL